MQKMQNNWREISAKLNAALQSCELSTREIAERSNVDYYAVRRMRQAGPTNRSQSAFALCEYFGINSAAGAETISATDLATAVQEAWDGTPQHAQLLMDLIRCARDYRVTSSAGSTGPGVL